MSLPRKRITNLDMLRAGKDPGVSWGALRAYCRLAAAFLILDEIDAPLDEENARRLPSSSNNSREKTQFIHSHTTGPRCRHRRALWVTMGEDGVSKVLSLKLEG